MWFALFFLLPVAHAAVPSTVIELSCAGKDGNLSLIMPEGLSAGLVYSPKNGTPIKCSVHLEKTSHFSRGARDVKTVYFSVESCHEKAITKPDEVPAPLTPGGYFSVTKRGKGNVAQLHALTNGQPLICKLVKLDAKKFSQFKL